MPNSPGEDQRPRQGIFQAEVDLEPSGDVPIAHINGFQTTFFGDEFIISAISAYPDPRDVGAGKPAPKRIKGRVVGKYALSARVWLSAVESFNSQLRQLREEGAPLPQPPEASR